MSETGKTGNVGISVLSPCGWSMPARSKGGGRGGTTSSSLISGVGGEGGDSLLMDYCSETVPSLTAGEFSMPPSGCSFMSAVKLWSMGNSMLLPCLIAEGPNGVIYPVWAAHRVHRNIQE